jgi:hypothetical protein
MAEFKEVMIQIRRSRRFIPHQALSSAQMSCNIIKRACVEELRQPWTPSVDGINYDFSDHASPPLGRCKLDWGWDGGSATRTDTFVVVEEIKGTPRGVILGPTDAQLPYAEPWNIDIFTIVMSRRSRGTDNSIMLTERTLIPESQNSRNSNEKETGSPLCEGPMRELWTTPG